MSTLKQLIITGPAELIESAIAAYAAETPMPDDSDSAEIEAVAVANLLEEMRAKSVQHAALKRQAAAAEAETILTAEHHVASKEAMLEVTAEIKEA